jgi:hypothetical protein
MSRPSCRPRNAASEVRVTSLGSGEHVSIPDAKRPVAAVLSRSTSNDSSIHSETCWQRVAAAGLALLPPVPDADLALVFLFALFHDSMRLNDDHDPCTSWARRAAEGVFYVEAYEKNWSEDPRAGVEVRLRRGILGFAGDPGPGHIS